MTTPVVRWEAWFERSGLSPSVMTKTVAHDVVLLEQMAPGEVITIDHRLCAH
jgi:hypothetical protein